MIGGKSYDKSPFNRSLYANRQTGSLFKTIVYLTAFEKGLTIYDKFIDEPIAVKNWYPENMSLILPIAIGALGGYFICFAHSNLTFGKYKPVLNVAIQQYLALAQQLDKLLKKDLVEFSPLVLSLLFV